MYYETAVSMSNYVRNYPLVRDQFHCLRLTLIGTCQSPWNFSSMCYTSFQKKKITGTILKVSDNFLSCLNHSTFFKLKKEGSEDPF